MGLVAAIGAGVRVEGFALAGAIVIATDDATAVREAWQGLANEVTVVLLTPRAAAALGEVLDRGERIYAVMPP